MFEKIVIKRHDKRGRLDAGLLAESLLYYSNVHILFSSGTLSSFLQDIGPEVLIDLLESKRISATFFADNLGTMTNTRNNLQFHNFHAFALAQTADGKKIKSRDWAVTTFERALGKSVETKKFAKKFLDLVPIRLHENPGEAVPIRLAAHQDLEDRGYVRGAIETILHSAVPAYALPTGWEFYTVQMDDGSVAVVSNLDLGSINREYHKAVSPKENTITNAWLLNQVFDARSDIHFAADYMAEFVTDATASAIVRRKFSSILRRRDVSESEIFSFQDMALRNGTALREAVNSGEKTFLEFLRLLDQADKFKEWLRTANPDVELLTEYNRAVSAESWLEKLPPKTVRFSFFALGAMGLEKLIPGSLGVAAGISLAAADHFLLDKLAKGWRPSQFVEGPLKDFVDS